MKGIARGRPPILKSQLQYRKTLPYTVCNTLLTEDLTLPDDDLKAKRPTKSIFANTKAKTSINQLSNKQYQSRQCNQLMVGFQALQQSNCLTNMDLAESRI